MNSKVIELNQSHISSFIDHIRAVDVTSRLQLLLPPKSENMIMAGYSFKMYLMGVRHPIIELYLIGNQDINDMISDYIKVFKYQINDDYIDIHQDLDHELIELMYNYSNGKNNYYAPIIRIYKKRFNNIKELELERENYIFSTLDQVYSSEECSLSMKKMKKSNHIGQYISLITFNTRNPLINLITPKLIPEPAKSRLNKSNILRSLTSTNPSVLSCFLFIQRNEPNRTTGLEIESSLISYNNIIDNHLVDGMDKIDG